MTGLAARDASTPEHRLAPLFRFSSIAVIGASETSSYGNAPHAALRSLGFGGRYVPVNARADEVHGVRAFRSVRDIPEPVDLALLAIDRTHVARALRECAECGVRAAVVVTAGFAESDEEGRRLQSEVAAIARETALVVLGPNCLGVASIANRCAAFASALPEGLVAGNVAVVSNSGGLMNEVLSYGNARGMGFSHAASTGNEAAITAADVIDFFVRDAASDVVLAVLESVRDAALFVDAAERAATARKPIVVLKIGASEKGTRAALTHTAALAGSDDAYSALFRQKGIIRVADLDELVEAGALLSSAIDVLRRRPVERAAIVEISGGGKALVCDLAEAAGIDLPDPSAASATALRDTLAERIEPSNPLDSGSAWGREDMGTLYPLALRTFASQPDVDAVVSRFTIPRSGSLGPLVPRIAELETAMRDHPDRLFAVLSRTSDRVSDDWLGVVRRLRLPFLQGYGRGLRALGALAAYSRFVWADAPRASVDTPAAGDDPDAAISAATERSDPGVAAVPSQLPAANVRTRWLDPLDVLELIASAGIDTVPSRRARSANEAANAATELGFPVALKVISPDIVHKTDAGGVRLGLADEHAVRTAFAEIEAATSRASVLPTKGATTDPPSGIGTASFDGVIVQRMAPPGGLEIVIGADRDAQLGPVVLFGLGGVFVESLRDVALGVAPLTDAAAESMLREIRGRALLEGARGGVPIDRGALVRAIRAVADLMLGRPDIASLDVNPVIAYPSGLVAVDARIAVNVS